MFEKYLAESKKVYEFQIGVCGELPEGFPDTMELALQRYSVSSMSAGKKTPIQERPLDFPNRTNCEVTYYDVAVNYPTTPQVLEEYISQCCGVERADVLVRTAGDPQIEMQDIKDDQPYVSKLDTEEMESADPKAQDHVGDNRVMELLKELEATRKDREVDPMRDVKAGESSNATITDGTTSPVGSK
jgi:hypothetical protein